jgi:hypothetical protein
MVFHPTRQSYPQEKQWISLLGHKNEGGARTAKKKPALAIANAGYSFP